ncbi:tRNA-wybutosine modification methyltransferase TYW3 [Pyrobaculum sp.]|uniref:tRNA(Phe) 7-((3-amino-3-carboxypropyl)-4-demethylwyosine(37)-N(4))- methyltransferase n=1 Tax=Pyrobaculum sp. TaxID=2004705 RepID=UPI003D0E2726
MGVVDRRVFEARKKAFVERLEREALQDRVDGDILPLLRLLNTHPDIYTTSSCSGRIMVAEAVRPSYSKGRGFRPVAKWHHPVDVDLVGEVAAGLDNAWLMVRGAILHLAAADAKTAYRLVELGRETGHKHSGVIAINRGGIFVEILGEERLDIPLKAGGRLLADLEAAVDMANKTLALAKLRLYWLAARIESALFGVEAPTSEEIRAAIRRFLQCL